MKASVPGKMTSDIAAIFDNSVVVVAHPDDEVLWLSSILDRASRIIFCFQGCATAPRLGPGRASLLAEYPLANAENLGIEEALSFNTADWERPRLTDRGIQIEKSTDVRRRYENNYDHLIRLLTPILGNYRNVFTHNPWGEYGHEDHIQVYRALRALQPGMKFNIWFSNYCSQISMKLMMEHISGFGSDYITLPTNTRLAGALRDLYKKHACWTWYNDYVWFKDECLMMDASLSRAEISRGHIFPINMLRTDFPRSPDTRPGFSRALRKLFRPR